MIVLTCTIQTAIRAMQFLCALIAMATLAAGFESLDSIGLTQMLGSHATNFGLLMTYTAMLYALYTLLAIDCLGLAPRPAMAVTLALDGVMTVLLLIAGIVLATCDYVKNCDSYGIALHCSNLTVGTVFTFLAMLAFGGGAAITMRMQSMNGKHEEAEAIPYVEEVTPTGALSPMGKKVMESPGAKV
jgi:Membrane-associating domain